VQAHQPRDDLSVAKWFQAFQVNASIDDRSGEIDDGRGFAEAETKRTQGWRLEAGEILWTGERVHQHPVHPNCVSVGFGESVEQAQAGLERQLLDGKRIEQALKDGRKARRFHAFEARSQWAEHAVDAGHAIELTQVDSESEQALDACANVPLDIASDALVESDH
jgi:hypothetical protein